nr:hypothetical protein [Tanacetum cinerariifolium]
MVGAGHAAYTDRFHELARLVPHLVTPESRKIKRYVYGLALQICGMVAATEPKTIQKVVQISDALTDEAVRNGSIKKVEKRGNVGEPSKDKNSRDDNKRTRTKNVFASTANPSGAWPKCTTCNSYHAPGGPCRSYFNFNRPGHLAKDCRGVPKNVNHVNARNPIVMASYECGSTNHVRDHGRGNQGNQARDKAFMLGAEEARRDPNIMTEIICHEKVVRIPQLDGKVLRVLGEKPKEKMRQLKGAKAKEKEQEEIVVARDFPEVFPDDLSGLLHVWEIEFRIELILGAKPVAKSPYRLAPSELEKLSDNSRNSKVKVSFDQVHRRGEHRHCSLRKRDEEVVVGEGVVVTSSSLEMLTNSCLAGIMVSLIFLKELEEEALVEFMIELFEKDKDDKKDGLFNLKERDQSRKA